MSKIIEPVPVESKEVKEWREADMPKFKHFNSREELEAHLKWVEEHKEELPF